MRFSFHGEEENLNGHEKEGHPRWWERYKQMCQVKSESGGQGNPAEWHWELSAIYDHIMEGLEVG